MLLDISHLHLSRPESRMLLWYCCAISITSWLLMMLHKSGFSFQAGTTKRMINLNDLAETLGSIKCKALALFHAFTGSDIVPLLSSLKGNGSATRHLRNCRPSWINFLLLQAHSSKHPHRFVKQHKISYVRCMTVMACLQPDKAATTTLILWGWIPFVVERKMWKGFHLQVIIWCYTWNVVYISPAFGHLHFWK